MSPTWNWSIRSSCALTARQLAGLFHWQSTRRANVCYVCPSVEVTPLPRSVASGPQALMRKLDTANTRSGSHRTTGPRFLSTGYLASRPTSGPICARSSRSCCLRRHLVTRCTSSSALRHDVPCHGPRCPVGLSLRRDYKRCRDRGPALSSPWGSGAPAHGRVQRPPGSGPGVLVRPINVTLRSSQAEMRRPGTASAPICGDRRRSEVRSGDLLRLGDRNRLVVGSEGLGGDLLPSTDRPHW